MPAVDPLAIARSAGLDALFHVLPFVGVALLCSRFIPRPLKLICVAVACACVTTDAVHKFSLGRHLLFGFLTIVYYVLVASLFWYIRQTGSGLGSFGKAVLFFVAFHVSLVLPLALLANSSAPALSVLGWKVTLSAYSFCTIRLPAQVEWREGVVFLLLDPALYFGERSRRVRSISIAGMDALRMTSAVPLLAGSIFLEHLAFVRLGATGPFGYADMLSTGALAFLSLYFAHSAVASIRIVCMRVLGFRVAEGYNWPIFAVSPADFWKRWNTYVGSWAKFHLFVPLSRLSMRPQVRTFIAARGALAIGLTFVAVGLLHDAFSFVENRAVDLRFTTLFFLSACALLIWRAAERIGRRAGVDALYQEKNWARFGVRFLSRFCFIQFGFLLALLHFRGFK